MRGLLAIALVALLAAAPAQAASVALGLEGFGSAGGAPTVDSLPVGLGLVLEERLIQDPLVLTIWEDLRAGVELPLWIGSLDSSYMAYYPASAGLRLGHAFGGFVPYVGAFGSAFLAQSGLSNSIPAAGGDVGLDWSVGSVVFGLEGRAEAVFTQSLGLLPLAEGLLSASFRL